MDQDWSASECEAIVGDYVAMLRAEMAGATYSKTRHRVLLALRLSGRTKASIVARHQDISAVLLAHGYRHIRGYKPKRSVKPAMEHVVLQYLHKHSEIARRLRVAGRMDDAGRPEGRPLPARRT